MTNKKIKWNGHTLDVSTTRLSVKFTFTNSENSVEGQYEFSDAIEFNEAYITNAVLRSLVGEDNNALHSFKRVTGLVSERIDDAEIDKYVDVLLDSSTKMNSTSQIGKASKILKLLHEDGPTALAKYVFGERSRIGTNDVVFGFSNYYSDRVIPSVLALMENDDSQNTPVEDRVFARLKAGAVPGFNWRNYEKLSEFGMQSHISNYDDRFRGGIEKIHWIDSGRYVIIETRKDGVKQYYSAHKYQDNNLFDTFEQCMLFIMCEPHFNSVLALYEHGRNAQGKKADAENTVGDKG